MPKNAIIVDCAYVKTDDCKAVVDMDDLAGLRRVAVALRKPIMRQTSASGGRICTLERPWYFVLDREVAYVFVRSAEGKDIAACLETGRTAGLVKNTPSERNKA